MTTVLIIVCILACIGVILAIVGHMGYAIHRDKERRGWLHRYHVSRTPRRRMTT